jgi:DNA modification methylase
MLEKEEVIEDQAIIVPSIKKKKRPFNQLDGKTWTRYSISVWDIIKTPQEMELKHPAMFPMELCKRLIEIYTHPNEVVLDPFMGSGSAVVAAAMLGRKGIGIDVNEEFVNLAKHRLMLGIDVDENLKPEIFCGDAKDLLNYVKENSVDLVITSPPYWSIHRRKRTADYKESRPYSELEKDLGNIEKYGDFMNALKEIFSKVKIVLKPKGHCIIIVMDIRVGSDFIPTSKNTPQPWHP